MMRYSCKVCGNGSDNREFIVKEMLLGCRTKFIYFQCSVCECLQIFQPPTNIGDYYPLNYYSAGSDSRQIGKRSLKQAIKLKRDEAALLNGRTAGKIINFLYPMDKEYLAALNNEIDFNLLKRKGLSFKSGILDVGCGQGHFLDKLYLIGFSKLLGIDPYAQRKIINNNFTIENKSIYDINSRFDLIVLNHSFEHMPEPAKVLDAVSRNLSENGVCMLRIPVVSSYAWDTYGVNWVQLDAPRHFFLYSIKGIKLLLEKTALKLQNIIYDSTDFQFWGSEQYLRDIPLRSQNSYWVNPKNSIFSGGQIAEFKRRAGELNIKKLGDQAVLYLTRN